MTEVLFPERSSFLLEPPSTQASKQASKQALPPHNNIAYTSVGERPASAKADRQISEFAALDVNSKASLLGLVTVMTMGSRLEE